MQDGTTFKKFWRALDDEQKIAFARRVKRSRGYLFLVAGGHRKASPKLARAFEKVSQEPAFGGFVSAKRTRPDVFRGVT